MLFYPSIYALYASEADCEYSPTGQQRAQPDGRPDVAFHNPVRRNFEECVREREHADCDGIVLVRHAGLLDQRVVCLLIENLLNVRCCRIGARQETFADLAIADVASIEVVQQVDECAQWKNSRVYASDEAFAAFLVFDEAASLESDLRLLLDAGWLLMVILAVMLGHVHLKERLRNTYRRALLAAMFGGDVVLIHHG